MTQPQRTASVGPLRYKTAQSSLSLPTMVNLYRRTLKRPLQTDSYPDALENLRALDSFTHDEERFVWLIAN